MEIKKNKSFSPYSYGIIYKKPGESPFFKYKYIKTGGLSEPIYVVTKRIPLYFCSITNSWFFQIDENEISLIKIESTIFIDKNKVKSHIKSNITSDDNYKSLKFEIKKNENGNFYQWESESSLFIFHNLDLNVDSVILLNNEYIDEKCEKYYYDGYVKIDFKNVIIKENDKLEIIIYPVSSSSSLINLQFMEEKILKSDILNDNINNNYLIKNLNGQKNKKFIVKLNNDCVLNVSSLINSPSYTLINKDEIENLNDIKTIISYSPIKYYKTFIVQRLINTNLINWNKNEMYVIINHGYEGNVNFIINNFDNKKFISKIEKIDNNYIKIKFNDLIYDPNVFSITIFKIGE